MVSTLWRDAPSHISLLFWLTVLLATTASCSDPQTTRAHGSLRQLEVTSADCSFGLFDVLLNWADPDAGQGRLRYGKCSVPHDVVREGTIFVMADRSQSLLRWLAGGTAETIYNSTGRKYDIVAWYPRGNGDASATVPGPAECFTSDAERKAFYVQSSLEMGIEHFWGDHMEYRHQQGPEDARDWLRLQTKMIEHCLSGQNQTMLSYIGTAATVRDLVAMADAFDGPGSPINFWGVGEDARIGEYLLQMFPERAGRIVLQAPLSLATLSRPGQNPFEVWREDVRHAHDSMIKQFAMGLEVLHGDDSNGSLPSDRQWTRASIVSGLMHTLEDVRRTYVGWRNSLEVDLDNSALNQTLGQFFEQATSVDVDTAAVANSVALLHRSQLHSVELTDLRRMSVLCGDQLGEYGPATAARVSHDMLSRIEQEFDLAPLLATSIFPSLPYFCHLWPLRATERLRFFELDGTSVEHRNVAFPPLIVQYDMNPFAPPRPPSSILPGIEEFSLMVESKSRLFEATRFDPQTCIGRSISDYLRDGILPITRLCRDDEGALQPEDGRGSCLHATGLSPSVRSEWVSDATETWLLCANVMGFVAIASLIMFLANMLAQSHATGVIRLVGEDEGVNPRNGLGDQY
ncbi:hypothetical protein C8Q70DRAFT_980456 [Cubamyces menziesii]|nr:hypothetical protein C8Q70DRAFT_980456 [Cubamyces menziesii]